MCVCVSVCGWLVASYDVMVCETGPRDGMPLLLASSFLGGRRPGVPANFSPKNGSESRVGCAALERI